MSQLRRRTDTNPIEESEDLRGAEDSMVNNSANYWNRDELRGKKDRN